jgi:hypothetical protein
LSIITGMTYKNFGQSRHTPTVVVFRYINQQITDWQLVTFQILLKDGYIQSQVNLDRHIPFK